MTVEVGVGSWSMQATHMRPRSWPALYQEAREEIRLAERLGFDSAWLGEHHFSYDGYCPSLLPAAAYFAASTKRIRLCAGVLLLPLHQPRRVREGCAAVESAAPGRLRVAFGLGYGKREFAAIDHAPSDRRRLMESHLDELLSGNGLGGTDLWIGGNAPAAVARAARRRLPFVLPSMAGPRAVARYREQYLAGAQAVPRLGIIKEVWVSRDPAELEQVRRQLFRMWRRYAVWWLDDPAAERDDRDETAARVTGKAIVGGPDEVLEQLARLVEAGAGVIVCRVRFDGLESEAVRDCMTLLAEEVLPGLRVLSPP
jgi:alkanesulfonate monooxygenase SsuD/methylene tetrahydromethanopterin reductase-like flavin-dependent oxidoreductase (luciferase family)